MLVQGPAAATGVALINSVANLGGMLGPSLIGAIKHHTESYTAAILLLSGATATACILVYFMPLPGFAVPAVQGQKGGGSSGRIQAAPGKLASEDKQVLV